MHPMAAVDAQFYWMSAKVPNDEFLLYAFDGAPADLGDVFEQIRRRARACPDLAVRVADDCPARYPRWVPTDVGPGCVVRRDLAATGWDGCLAAVAGLAEGQLDARRLPWQLHVFTPVHGVPCTSGPGTVAVLQVAHALGDGVRASAMAARLFGRPSPVPAAVPSRAGRLPRRAVAAARAHRRFVADTEAGRVPAPLGTRPPLPTNTRPECVRAVRTLVRDRSQLCGPTVTVAVLAAVGSALRELFGDSADTLGAEVPMTKPGVRQANNHFANAVVGLYPGDADRLRRIETDLANARRRLAHPAGRAADQAFAAMPAALLRWGVSRFDTDVRPVQVAGNTVVSSVHRGPADLRFGGAPVVLTCGYPALSPAMGLTHGVHGIGDTVAISVHAAESALPDPNAYVRLLDAAL
ncbi:WS/DGAT domain-containing protein [Mycobacterium sp.]|uniref:WS/DGAT domain-containing protein n=1 Tax=Mycobacterium sp. TaxID=1785 RepID=UPI003A87616D